MESHDNFASANRRARGLQASMPRAVSARYDRKSGRIVIQLSSHRDVSFSPRDAQGLEKATPAQLKEIEITPSGFGIHFPKLDADLYLPCNSGGLSRLQEMDGIQAWRRRRKIAERCQAGSIQGEWKTGRAPQKSRLIFYRFLARRINRLRQSQRWLIANLQIALTPSPSLRFLSSSAVPAPAGPIATRCRRPG